MASAASFTFRYLVEGASARMHSRLVRRIGIGVLAAVVLFGIFGFIGVPIILRHVITGSVGASLKRPTSVGRISFNPYTLHLDLENLHIGDRNGSASFVDIGRANIRVSWSSLWRLAPVVKELTVDRPALHVVRLDKQGFNFSDLIESKPPAPQPAKPAKPQLFAISNIEIARGSILFDDNFLGEHHKIDNIRLDIPFIANLPADTNIYVQPFLSLTADGSPLRIGGRAKPFASLPVSSVDINLHRLDLRRYVAYLGNSVPVNLKSGFLSSALRADFVSSTEKPRIRLSGAVALEKMDVRDRSDAQLAGLVHAVATLDDVEPLTGVFHLGRIRITGLDLRFVREKDGATNVSALMGTKAAPQTVGSQGGQAALAPSTSGPVAQQPAAPPLQVQNAAPASNPTPGAAPPDVRLRSFQLVGSSVRITDNSGATPANLSLNDIEASAANIDLNAHTPATFQTDAKLGSNGGEIKAAGSTVISESSAAVQITLNAIDLAALQNFASPYVTATLASGKLTADSKLNVDFRPGKFDLHAAPAEAGISDLDLLSPDGSHPVGWKKFSVNVAQLELASRQVNVSAVKGDAVHLFVRRERDGKVNLLSLLRTQSQPSNQQVVTAGGESTPTPAAHGQPGRSTSERRNVRAAHKSTEITGGPGQVSNATPAATPQWQVNVADITFDNTQTQIEDYSNERPVKLDIAPLNIHFRNVSSDLAKPLDMHIDGHVNRRGEIKIDGKLTPAPLKGELKVVSRNLDLSPAMAYAGKNLNVVVSSAALSTDSRVNLAQERKDFRVRYQGDVALTRVRMLDRVTGDRFAGWSNFSANGISAEIGRGDPRVRIGTLALADFYARVILNRDGHLNLSDLTANPQTGHVSVTTAGAKPAARAEQAAPVERPPESAPKQIPADVAIGRVLLKGGHVNYSDDFIKPNYSADLTDIAGTIGSFGTRSTAPAEVDVTGVVNGSAPLAINGSVNPLAPMAFVDLKAKAEGVELANVSPYTTKYTGYPITKGTLTVDVHYLLEHQNLTAENHIFIDQLTFGDHVDSPNAINLPIRLAVAILKNSRGEIDLRVPVSGSLSDPQFSIGSVVLHAFMNIIVKAATAPFSLIASAFGGSSQQDLSYIEFQPGRAVITPASQGRLDTIAKALQAKPSLKLNISGRVDPKVDTDGLREARLDALVVEHLGGRDSAAELTPGSDDYNKGLKRAYKAAKFDKPTDLVGLTKSLPPDEMRKLMLEHIDIGDKDLQQLAEERAAAVRRALGKQVDASRLFTASPKLNAEGIKDSGKSTRADLSLE